ncbi:hypothetical protein GW933_02635 [Candidatus Falkowbacteria bacterium]|nr:hypothetical protein [Candidatus Falkowbacteria bacterium]
MIESDNWIKIFPQVLIIIFFELGFAIISLPMYFIVSPKKVQEKGFIFSINEEKENNKESIIWAYTARRRISLTTGFGAGTFIILKVLLIIFTSFYLLGGQALLAATENWAFDSAEDYTYDSAKIEVVGGVAQLKNIGATTSGATTNSGFDSDATGWTYADWLNNPGASGAYYSTGGNPDGNIEITLSSAKNKTTAGLYRQSFITTINSPDTATLNFDWSSISYSVPAALDTYQLYVFIDTTSGNPTLGQEVWSSGEISNITPWASSATIDIASKLPIAGTYYLKIVAYHDTPGDNGKYTTVAGFDNVIVNWSKTTVSYASDKPTINPTTSLFNELVTIWDSFIETATKNGGEIYYQLSNDDGATWQYYDGSAWTTAGETNYNTASVVNSNIATFDVTNHKIRWKAFLEGDGSQEVILDNVVIGYTENDPPHIQNLDPTQNTTSSLVYVNYELKDDQSDRASLVTYEYSLTGDFAGEEVIMTASTTDSLHDSVVNLSSSPAGVAQTFVWDAQSQLGAIYNPNVYIRLRGNDGINNGDYATSTVAVDYAPPVITNLLASQVLGSGDVTITYDLSDDTADSLLVEISISDDGGSTWVVPTTSTSGDIGSNIATSTGKSITWSADTDFSNQEQNDIRIRLRATDAYGNISDYVESTDFSVDTAGPSGLINLSKFSSTDTTVTLKWSEGITDGHFDHYEIWHGSIISDVNNRAGIAEKWDQVDDINLSNINTISTVITGLDISNDYYMKIWAVDNYGNEATLEAINIYEAPVIAEPSGGSSSGGGPTLEFISPDIISPVKPILNPVDIPTSFNNIFISGLAEPRSIIDLYDNGLLVGRLISTVDNNGRFGQGFNFSDGAHILTVKSIDFSSNTSEPSDELIIMINPTTLPADIDAIPVISLDSRMTPLETGSGVPTISLPSSSISLETGLTTPSLPLPSEVNINEIIESTEVPSIMVPEVSAASVSVINNNIIQFSGKSLPNQDIVVYIHSDQALIYQTKADKDGNWTINHSQDIVELAPGQHSIFAVTVDPVAKVKSLPSEVKLFEVKRNLIAVIFNLLNIQTTIVTLIIVSITIFWLYRLRKQSLVSVIA